jgi:acetoin utilization protein AcuB
MLVEQVMQTGVVTITPKTSLPEALALIRQRGIRHLPVVENDALVGIVSDRDLKRAMASSATSLDRHELQYLLDRVTAAEIMTPAVITASCRLPIEEAARLMLKEKISALPVTEEGRLIGIVTETDVLQLFVQGMGAGEPSSRIDVRVRKDGSGLADLVHAVEEAQVEIASIMTLSDRSEYKDVVIRVRSIDPRTAIAKLRARGYEVRGPMKV